MYVNGLRSLGAGYENLLNMLLQQIGTLGCSDVRIMTISAGGFVGLRAAIDLQANSFAGTGIKTTLSRDSVLPPDPFQLVIEHCEYADMLIDLRR